MSKRVIKTVLSVSLATAMAFSAVACINKPSETEETEEATEETREESILRPVIEETVVTETTETEPPETTLNIEYIVDTNLLGNWTYEDEGYVYTYTFNNDNTGYFKIVNTENEGSDIGLDFIYTANGNSFTMYYDGEEGDMAYYSINGDILTIDTGVDDPVELTR